ncbi:MAG: hypothetical protein PHT32_09420, partial [Candidatus Omnitrophica bacterium]|nr:hypothetical protein [Candidatus Omnitrophota bacterium]
MAHSEHRDVVRDVIKHGRFDKALLEALKSASQYYSPGEMAGLRRLGDNIKSVLSDIMSGKRAVSEPAEVEESREGAARAPTAAKPTEAKPAETKPAVKAPTASEKISAVTTSIKTEVLSVLPSKSELKDMGSSVMKVVTRLAPAPVPVKPAETKPAKPAEKAKPAAAQQAEEAKRPAAPAQTVKEREAAYDREYDAFSKAAEAKNYDEAFKRLQNSIDITEGLVRDGHKEYAEPLKQLKEDIHKWLLNAYRTDRPKEYAFLEQNYKEMIAYCNKNSADYEKAEKAGDLKKAQDSAFSYIANLEYLIRRKDGLKMNPGLKDMLKSWEDLHESIAEMRARPSVVQQTEAQQPAVKLVAQQSVVSSARTAFEQLPPDAASLSAEEVRAEQTTHDSIVMMEKAIKGAVTAFCNANKIKVTARETTLLTEFFATYAVTHRLKSADMEIYLNLMIRQYNYVEELAEAVTTDHGKSIDELKLGNPWLTHMMVLPLNEMEKIEKILLGFKRKMKDGRVQSMSLSDLGFHSYFARRTMRLMEEVRLGLRDQDIMQFMKREFKQLSVSSAILAGYFGRPMNFNDPFDLGWVMNGYIVVSQRDIKDPAAVSVSNFMDEARSVRSDDFGNSIGVEEGYRINEPALLEKGIYYGRQQDYKHLIEPYKLQKFMERLALLGKDDKALAEWQKKTQERQGFPPALNFVVGYMCERLYGRPVELPSNRHDMALVNNWQIYMYIKCRIKDGYITSMGLEDFKKVFDVMGRIKAMINARFGPVTDDDVKASALFGSVSFLESTLAGSIAAKKDSSIQDMWRRELAQTRREIREMVEIGR